MAIDDLKENLTEKLQALWSKINESPLFIFFKEKYDVLTPNHQQIFKVAVAALFVTFLLYIPYSNYSSNSELVEEYESKREDLSDLLKAKAAGNLPNIAKEKSFIELKSQVDQLISQSSLVEEQIGEVETYSQTSVFIPKSIKETGLQFELKKLNVTQIRDISHSLQTRLEDAILTGIDIKASTDNDHYFDVLFIIKNLFIPDENLNKGSDKKKRSRRQTESE